MKHGLLFLAAVCLTGQQGGERTAHAQNPPAAAPAVAARSAATAVEVTFPAGDHVLHGFLYKPAGPGPFPAVIWNHGSGTRVGRAARLANLYVEKGFAVLVPHRSGHGRSPGVPIADRQRELRDRLGPGPLLQSKIIELHELYLRDVIAAVTWLKAQPFVDPDRMVMTGVSFGGIQTLLAAEQNLGIRAFVPFAPAAMSWKKGIALRQRLLLAVQRAKAPVFLVQAANDYDLGPSRVLGPALAQKGGLNRFKVYPAYGSTMQEGHGKFAMAGGPIWAADVFAFLAEALR